MAGGGTEGRPAPPPPPPTRCRNSPAGRSPGEPGGFAARPGGPSTPHTPSGTKFARLPRKRRLRRGSGALPRTPLRPWPAGDPRRGRPRGPPQAEEPSETRSLLPARRPPSRTNPPPPSPAAAAGPTAQCAAVGDRGEGTPRGRRGGPNAQGAPRGGRAGPPPGGRTERDSLSLALGPPAAGPGSLRRWPRRPPLSNSPPPSLPSLPSHRGGGGEGGWGRPPRRTT